MRADGPATAAAAPARALHVTRLGRADYQEVLALQERERAAVAAGAADRLLLVEHPPVITLGRGGDARHVLAPRAPVLRVNRGGDVTYHGPGQLVGYPIVDLRQRRCDVHAYLRDLEDVLIGVGERFGVAAGRRPGLTGVWVGHDKLAAIGVGIRRWVTMHGFALNVADLRAAFAAIVPCGVRDGGVTSLEQLTGRRPALADVERAVVDVFAAHFGYAASESDAPGGPAGDGERHPPTPEGA
jgi:lipoyl(octanoyl) transferase